MARASMRSARGDLLRLALRVGSAASQSLPSVPSASHAAAKASRALRWSSRHSGAGRSAPFSTARKSVVVRSLLSDIQALERVHELLSAPHSPLSEAFEVVLQRLEQCDSERRCVFVTGIGKSGIVARRFAATLASISVRSQWVHGSEWTHGDLGNLQSGDVIIVLSHSGNTTELQSLPALAASRGVDTIAIVGQDSSSMAASCLHTLVVPAIDPPQCPVPSRSIIVQEAICNAIVEQFVDELDSRPNAFRDNHPGGAIGDGFSRS